MKTKIWAAIMSEIMRRNQGSNDESKNFSNTAITAHETGLFKNNLQRMQSPLLACDTIQD